MIEVLNSIVHSIAELVMEKKEARDKAKAKAAEHHETKPITPLTPKEEAALLLKLYALLALLIFLVGAFLLFKKSLFF